LDFKRLRDYEPDYKDWSFFGGSSCHGVRLGVSTPTISSSEGKARFKKALGLKRVYSCPSGDGKVTWEEYFEHPDTPGVVFTIYDWKGGMSCGFGIHNGVYRSMSALYAEKLNRMLAQLVSFTLGG
jgi:hypothetical protein